MVNEAQFCTALQKWCGHNLNKSALIEAKVAKTGKFYYKNIALHQMMSLQNAKHRKIIFKISDADFRSHKPADIFMLKKSDAYIALMFLRPRNKRFYMIDIDAIVAEIKNKKNGLTEAEAKEIGINCELK